MDDDLAGLQIESSDQSNLDAAGQRGTRLFLQTMPTRQIQESDGVADM
jgi:hypothetical protein